MISPVSVLRHTLKSSYFIVRKLPAVAVTSARKPNQFHINSWNGASSVRPFTATIPNVQKDQEQLEVVFIKANGDKITAKAKVGDTLLDVVVNNSLDFDGFGACEGTLTCSTCHLIFSPETYEKLPEKPGDEECDMLDLAYDLTDTSRLGCQITLTKEMNGLEIRVPATINDARAQP